jgi:hypothetical protein
MLHVLWAILNVGLFLFFITICFKATIIIREKLGLFASIIFVFGLLSFVSNSGNNDEGDKNGQNQVEKWKLSSENEITPSSLTYTQISIDKTLMSTINLGVSFGKEKISNKYVAIEANSIMLGLVCGQEWKPLSIYVEPTAINGKFRYIVTGTLKWKLLGTTFYYQYKTYSGFITRKSDSLLMTEVNAKES